MSKITDSVNSYFIEMISSKKTKAEMSARLKKHINDRGEKLPDTNSAADAFYVVLGCKFQDNPTQSLFFALCFILAVGLFLASFLMSFIR